MDVIGQLTKEMSPQQIERLLVQTKQKLQGTNSVPLLQPALAVTPTEAGLQKRAVQPDLSLSQQQQQSRPRKSTKGISSSHSRGSMNDVQYNKHVDTSDEEDVADLSNSGRPKPGGLITKQRSNSTKDSNLAHGSAKNLSVRFDPNQVQTSPHMEHQMVNVQQGGPQQPPNSSRPPRGHGGGHHRSHHGHHKSSHGGGHSGDPGSSRHRSRSPEPRQASIDRPGGNGSLSRAYDEHRHRQVYNFWCFLPLHRGAFCQVHFQLIYYCHSSKSSGNEPGKTHLCAVY